MRINKYIAAAGIASRRKADELIKNGKVKVNGAVLKEPGYDVTDFDTVEVLGQLLSGTPKSVYYALNKPVGYVSTLADEKGRPTVVDLLTDVTARVFPVGRLDCDTSGLLILTNDGKLANRVAHPKNKIWKTYRVRINGVLTKNQILELQNGVEIDVNNKPYKTKPAQISQISCSAQESLLEIKISEGKNRQIRKMVEAVGFRVLELERTAIGDIPLGRTKPGSYRKLSAAEIDYLKNC